MEAVFEMLSRRHTISAMPVTSILIELVDDIFYNFLVNR
jgi:hypothetical protein